MSSDRADVRTRLRDLIRGADELYLEALCNEADPEEVYELACELRENLCDLIPVVEGLSLEDWDKELVLGIVRSAEAITIAAKLTRLPPVADPARADLWREFFEAALAARDHFRQAILLLGGDPDHDPDDPVPSGSTVRIIQALWRIERALADGYRTSSGEAFLDEGVSRTSRARHHCILLSFSNDDSTGWQRILAKGLNESYSVASRLPVIIPRRAWQEERPRTGRERLPRELESPADRLRSSAELLLGQISRHVRVLSKRAHGSQVERFDKPGLVGFRYAVAVSRSDPDELLTEIRLAIVESYWARRKSAWDQERVLLDACVRLSGRCVRATADTTTTVGSKLGELRPTHWFHVHSKRYDDPGRKIFADCVLRRTTCQVGQTHEVRFYNFLLNAIEYSSLETKGLFSRCFRYGCDELEGPGLLYTYDGMGNMTNTRTQDNWLRGLGPTSPALPGNWVVVWHRAAPQGHQLKRVRTTDATDRFGWACWGNPLSSSSTMVEHFLGKVEVTGAISCSLAASQQAPGRINLRLSPKQATRRLDDRHEFWFYSVVDNAIKCSLGAEHLLFRAPRSARRKELQDKGAPYMYDVTGNQSTTRRQGNGLVQSSLRRQRAKRSGMKIVFDGRYAYFAPRLSRSMSGSDSSLPSWNGPSDFVCEEMLERGDRPVSSTAFRTKGGAYVQADPH